MVRNVTYISCVAVMAATCAAAFGGIPVPDAVLYGSVRIDCRPVSSSADVTVVARVDGVADPVGNGYFVADGQGGFSYVLNIQLESTVDGLPRSPGTARAQDTVHIYVKQGADPERLVTNYLVGKMGVVQQLNLEVHANQCPGDSNDDGDVDLSDVAFFQTCFTGTVGGVPAGCDVCNANSDGNVNLDDWPSVQALLFGPQ